MSARTHSRFTTAQSGWIALAVFAGWLVFLLVPAPRKTKPPASNELPPMAAPSKLELVGLANNPDWQGLPGYFAIWADSVEWVGGKTYFAYWNPGSYSYSYFFEATRTGESIRFGSIAEKTASERMVFDTAALAQYAAERKDGSTTHPFVFPLKRVSSAGEPPPQALPRPPDPPRRVEINSGAQPITPPPVKLPDAEPKK